MTDAIEISRSGAAQVLRIVRPEKKNALTQAMYRALADAIETGEADGSVAVHVLFGQPGIFSAGNDIGDFLAQAGGAGALPRDVVRFIELLPAVSKPLVAGADGLAVGVGATLLLHCDLVYVTPRTVLSTPFLDLGLVPEAGSSLLLPRRVGHVRAFEMLVLGEPFEAERAREAGLVNRIVAPEDLEAVVLATADRLAQKPPSALATARRLLRGESAETMARMREESELFRSCLVSLEAREAFQAFLEKRKPDFAKFRGSGTI
ncbi:MAG: crotonase/enoyl-CoA hydratase family protein [Hyphomicrobium sp.]|nr:crotonase/enoyl-CoA hydratase family protein [Hyphomicrobium sp.]